MPGQEGKPCLSHTQIKKIWHLVQEMPAQRALVVSFFFPSPTFFFSARKFIKVDPVPLRDLSLGNISNFWPEKAL